MKFLHITTNVGCKNSCVYCPWDKFLEAYKERSHVLQMSFDVFRTCLDKVPAEVAVDFSGMSEPWLNPSCTKMLLHAYEKKHPICVSTTLVGMSLSDVEKLETIPGLELHIHLPDNEGSEKIKVDENYLDLLGKVDRSRIKTIYHTHGRAVHRLAGERLGKTKIPFVQLHTRAGNTKIKNAPPVERKRGVLHCTMRNAAVLLPNGDVVLCCMDWGLKHVLGNLLISDYPSLSRGREFSKINKGLRDESLDILCRYCEWAANGRFRIKKGLWDRYVKKIFVQH